MTPKVATVYNHVQDTPSSTWVIEHWIGGYPIVDAFTPNNGDLVKILPASVEYTSPNTCTLTFSSAISGFATVL